MDSRSILGTRIDATSYAAATAQVIDWAREGRSRYVCAANVHMVMEGHDDPAFQQIVNGAALVTPDGMPLVLALRSLGVAGQQRVYGPTLMLHLVRAAARAGVPIALYGGHPEALEPLQRELRRQAPGLTIAFAQSPPFRPLDAAEEAGVEARMIASGARLLFVGLGCPKQERWMAARSGRLPLVMVGVGAAFDFHAGRVVQAPALLQALSLEWAFRLAIEPRRLWKRYARHNPRFVGLFARQLLGGQPSPDRR